METFEGEASKVVGGARRKIEEGEEILVIIIVVKTIWELKSTRGHVCG